MLNKRIERQGAVTSPMVNQYPTIRAGICDRCGVLDPNVDSIHQYKLCGHYRGLGPVACSYCPATTNPDEVIAMGILRVYDHPDRPDQIVVVCDRSECVSKHYKRFQVNN